MINQRAKQDAAGLKTWLNHIRECESLSETGNAGSKPGEKCGRNARPLVINRSQRGLKREVKRNVQNRFNRFRKREKAKAEKGKKKRKSPSGTWKDEITRRIGGRESAARGGLTLARKRRGCTVRGVEDEASALPPLL